MLFLNDQSIILFINLGAIFKINYWSFLRDGVFIYYLFKYAEISIIIFFISYFSSLIFFYFFFFFLYFAFIYYFLRKSGISLLNYSN